MKQTRTMEVISLIGVTLSIFGFIFGVWSGVIQTGLETLLELSSSLAEVDIPGETPHAKIIFFILVGVIIFVAIELVTHFTEVRARHERWPIIRALSAFLCIAILLVLFYSYNARNSGVLITSFGQLFVLGSSLVVTYRRSHYRFLDRKQAAEVINRDWQEKLALAALYTTPVAIFALKTSKYLVPSKVETFIKELKAADMVFPFKDGAYVLLWNIPVTATEKVAQNLKSFLQTSCQIQSEFGAANFPADGNHIIDLVEKANQNLSSQPISNIE